MREVEYRSSGVPLEEYELTRGDHRRQKQSKEISEWARRQVEEDYAKCRADPERAERRRQAFENVAKLMQSFKKADHEIMRWRVRLYCGHIIETEAHYTYPDPLSAGSYGRRCSECGKDRQTIVGFEPSSWVRIPRFDHTPSERLRFVLSGGQPHRASESADTPGHSLEEQLAEISQEVTLRGEAAERRRQDEIEAARQKRIRWEAAMEEARIRYAEAYCIRHLEAQEAAWRHATGLTEYVSAVRVRVEAMPPGQARTDAEAWISWAATTVERLDPLSSPPRLPDVPEPRADDLRPFLGHWSPYGPTS
ncbi:hypothetical protein [Streptomyces gelaticus]|nr:hypothetical protein [Streptomyces gelaticus]